MPSGNRKSLTLPAETYDRFLSIHEETKPNNTAPHWVTVERLLDLHTERER